MNSIIACVNPSASAFSSSSPHLALENSSVPCVIDAHDSDTWGRTAVTASCSRNHSALNTSQSSRATRQWWRSMHSHEAVSVA